MAKIKLIESDLKTLIDKVLLRENNEFGLSPEGKLEFLITSINNLINAIDNGTTSGEDYISQNLKHIVQIATEDNTDNSVEGGLEEETLNEWQPDVNYNAWRNIDDNGAAREAERKRKAETRKENSENEKSEGMNTIQDFTKFLYVWKDADETDNVNTMYKLLLQKYKDGVLKLKDLNAIAQFEPIQHRMVIPLLKDFVNKEEERTGILGLKYGNKTSNAPRLQPKG